MKLLLPMLAFALFISACGTTKSYVAPRLAPPIKPQFVNLVTPNITITAVDNSWSIQSGKPFTPKNSFKIYPAKPTYMKINKNSPAGEAVVKMFEDMNKRKKDNYERGEDNNRLMRTRSIKHDISIYKSVIYKEQIMDVKIEDGSGVSLYGKMLFLKVHSKSKSSSAKRMWTVSVPKSYLNTAKSGNVAVLYQPYKVKGTYESERVSWVLWMSKLPL